MFDQVLHACSSRVSEEEEVRGSTNVTPPRPEEVETRRDEAGPSAAEVSSSRPHKLQARRPHAPSPARAEMSSSDEDGLGLGEVPVYPPPKRARTASELAELGQVRLSCVVSSLFKLLVFLLMFFFCLFVSDAIA